MYTLQPPEDIVCSPYNRGVLNLTCAVSGDLVADIHWYFQSAEEGSQASILTNSSQVTITHSEFDGDYSVIMIVEGLTAANEGFYWCQGLVWHQDQSLELSQSAVFELRPRDQYFPINCPNKALKSSEVRCAAVIPLPVVSSSGLPFHGHTSTFEVLLPTDESLGVGLDPSRTVPGHSFTVPTKLPTARPSPTSRPTVTDNTIGGDGTTDRPPTGPLTDTSATTAQPPLSQGTVQLSDIILYAILGLLGFLVVLVFSLSIVISILCCKKRHRNLQGTHNISCIVAKHSGCMILLLNFLTELTSRHLVLDSSVCSCVCC